MKLLNGAILTNKSSAMRRPDKTKNISTPSRPPVDRSISDKVTKENQEDRQSAPAVQISYAIAVRCLAHPAPDAQKVKPCPLLIDLKDPVHFADAAVTFHRDRE